MCAHSSHDFIALLYFNGVLYFVLYIVLLALKETNIFVGFKGVLITVYVI